MLLGDRRELGAGEGRLWVDRDGMMKIMMSVRLAC